MDNYIGVSTPTGFVQRVDNPGDRIPDYDPRSGEHLWSFFLMFKANPERLIDGEQALFDSESLMEVQGPGCYYCEVEATPRMLKRRCPGKPRD